VLLNHSRVIALNRANGSEGRGLAGAVLT
jgi:hypothetical protein